MSADLVLSDFGFAVYQVAGTVLTDFPGTAAYAAPEVILGEPYDGRASDVWSLGICLYALATKTLPFYDENRAALADKIVYNTPYMPEYVPPELQVLILGMLNKSPKWRFPLARIQAHPWLVGRY